MLQKNYTHEQLAELLRGSGIKPTHQRMAIAHVIFSWGEHLSAEQIMALVNDESCETSKATVYNTLRLFIDKKLIRDVIVDPSKVFYDPNPQPHHHFYNIDTGELTDIDAHNIRLSGLPALPHGVVAAGVDIIVRIRSASA